MNHRPKTNPSLNRPRPLQTSNYQTNPFRCESVVFAFPPEDRAVREERGKDSRARGTHSPPLATQGTWHERRIRRAKNSSFGAVLALCARRAEDMYGMSRTTPASCAVLAEQSLGRVHAEAGDPWRDAFEVDRQRILSSAAFRRLQYKTQVFVSVEHDHFRTRLTHTLEVVEIARRLAVGLGANERLAEAIALAHDLGHAPFGHAGEAALGALTADAGGFEHNAHALRVVDYLEHPYPEFRGLNLSFEVREGLIKHSSVYDQPDVAAAGGPDVSALLATGPFASIEGQIASMADRMAYDCHDVEDAIGADLVTEADLSEVTLWVQAAEPVRAMHPGLSLPAVRRPILSGILDRLLADVIEATRGRLVGSSVSDVASVRRADSELAAFSERMNPPVCELERLLAERVYQHRRVVKADAEARRMIEHLFEYYLQDADRLPQRFASRVGEQGRRRVVCDYIAGMTDRFCRGEHARLFGAAAGG